MVTIPPGVIPVWKLAALVTPPGLIEGRVVAGLPASVRAREAADTMIVALKGAFEEFHTQLF
jgi:hypothetical protein